MRKFPPVLAMVFLGTTLSISLWSVEADQPTSDSSAAKQNDDESSEVRFARAHLKLAKLDLRRVIEENNRIPGVYPADFVEQLRLHVVIDETHLAQCLMGEDADPHRVCIRSAESAVKIAEWNLKRKRDANQRAVSAVGALEVERAEVVAEIATLNLERTTHLENSESVVTHLQWQIDELRHQVLELQMRR